ncbi:MAG: carboxylesterase family protein, partial [Bdellovibrionales bacterium]|nr:carboxylesterase family protein [Bdellovibrionales bacterium]
MKHLSLCGFLLFLFFASPLSAQTGEKKYTSTVSLHSGKIRGERADGVNIFRGIPFAAPPVGPLRWKAPQPIASWTGVKDCIEFGPACPQPNQKAIGKPPKKQSEDCLYLNVWTTSLNPAKKMPVMFWIHGGGNSIGTGSQPTYYGHNLARKG